MIVHGIEESLTTGMWIVLLEIFKPYKQLYSMGLRNERMPA